MVKKSERMTNFTATERQWKREHRIANAKYELSIASEAEKPFWLHQLERLR